MPSEDTKILEFNQYQKFDKTPFVIYPGLGFLIEKTDGSKNSCTTKVGEHSPSGFLISIILLFKNIENKHDV